MPNDKDPKCPGCGETTLDPNEYHSGLKTKTHPINGKMYLLVYCANCGHIIGLVNR